MIFSLHFGYRLFFYYQQQPIAHGQHHLFHAFVLPHILVNAWMAMRSFPFTTGCTASP